MCISLESTCVLLITYRPFSLDHLDDYNKHFTVMNYVTGGEVGDNFFQVILDPFCYPCNNNNNSLRDYTVMRVICTKQASFPLE